MRVSVRCSAFLRQIVGAPKGESARNFIPRFVSSSSKGADDLTKERDAQVKGALADFIKSDKTNEESSGGNGFWGKLADKQRTDISPSGDSQSRGRNRSRSQNWRDNRSVRAGEAGNRRNQSARGVGAGHGDIPEPEGFLDDDMKQGGLARRERGPRHRDASKQHHRHRPGGVASDRMAAPGGPKRRQQRRLGKGMGARGPEREARDGRRRRGEFTTVVAEDPIDGVALNSVLMPHLRDMARAGHYLDTAGMDAADTMLSQWLMTSLKTSTSTTAQTLELPPQVEQQPPRPRSSAELLYAMQPRLRAESAPEGSIGHHLGSAVWDVVGQNHYYADHERVMLANGVAAEAEAVLALAAEFEAAQGDLDLKDSEDSHASASSSAIDSIFDPAFRKGRRQMEEEERLAALRGRKVEVYEGQGETDWSQEAVLDEDDL